MNKIKIIICFSIISAIFSQKILIPMDQTQTDHIKAYGIAFWSLENNQEVDWLLNYKGGSFLLLNNKQLQNECIIRGVSYHIINSTEVNGIYQTIEENNMEIVLLEKSPKIAVYSPPDKQPWDDAVTLALTYADVAYPLAINGSSAIVVEI